MSSRPDAYDTKKQVQPVYDSPVHVRHTRSIIHLNNMQYRVIEREGVCVEHRINMNNPSKHKNSGVNFKYRYCVECSKSPCDCARRDLEKSISDEFCAARARRRAATARAKERIR